VGISEIEVLDDGGLPAAAPPRPYRPWPPSPAAALMAVAVTIAAALGLAVTTGGAAGGRFDLVVVSAGYSVPRGSTSMVLDLSLRNVGGSIIELTDLSIVQPGLIPSSVDNGFGLPPLPVALPPQRTVSVPLIFSFDCGTRTRPAAATTAQAFGYDTRGAARVTRLALPSSADPWLAGGQVRGNVCSMPTPQDDLTVRYGGSGGVLLGRTPVRFVYTVLLTAPSTRSVTVAGLTHDNPGVTATFDPPLPITVLDGQTVRVTVTWQVLNCVLARDGTVAGGVQVMAANPREVENWDARLGALYARDMAAQIQLACLKG
jgi:hypothetical protein